MFFCVFFTSTMLYIKTGFSKTKQIFDKILQFTIYNNYICHDQKKKSVNIHWNAQVCLIFFVFFFIPKRVVQLIPSSPHLHYRRFTNVQLYNQKYVFTTRVHYSYRLNIKKNYKCNFIYIYMQKSTPSIHYLFIQARPQLFFKLFSRAK